MRNLVFALILANLAFAAWDRWYASDTVAPAAAEREFGDILLATEFAAESPSLEIATVRIDEAPARSSNDERASPNEPDAAAIDPDAATATGAAADPGTAPEPAEGEAEFVPPIGPPPAERPAPAVAACTSVGPFRELSQVTSAAANLRADGYMPRQRAGEGEIWSGYWVYLERIASVAEAQTMIEHLHANEISDAYVIPNSDSGILISLGVFSEIIRASRIRERVRELGYDATIADRVRRASVYWIDIDLAAGDELDFERLQPPGRIIRLERRSCAEVEF
jgi:hypothetical protein